MKQVLISFSLCDLCPLWLSRFASSFENSDFHATVNRQPSPHTDGQSNIGARYMPRAKTKSHGDAHVTDCTQNHFFECVVLIGSLTAVDHFSEDQAAHILQLAG